MKRVLILLIGLLIIVPGISYAEEILATSTKYYKTITSTLLSSNDNNYTTTVEVSKDEYEKFDPEQEELNRLTSYVETTYKRLTIILSQVGSFYRYKAELEWRNIPSTRSNDILAIGYYSTVTNLIDPIFKNEYCISGGGCLTSTGYYLNQGTNGISTTFQLPTGSLTLLKQSMLVDIVKTNPNVTLQVQKTCADFAHATRNISISNALNHTLSLTGIILNSSNVNYYDSITGPCVTWNGTW